MSWVAWGVVAVGAWIVVAVVVSLALGRRLKQAQPPSERRHDLDEVLLEAGIEPDEALDDELFDWAENTWQASAETWPSDMERP